ncbi:P-loop containing nucleoside triphosphate hydrolase protein [Aaosphaeria arxii CBS 175.79]|uniref:P-loop containing nucleoside triphosphate hydrolase protein n=1 Tax=Aaosphaeria arxii CBS 175.79 TaxID=1450172 RepID=A0A6A5X978_9PLEO|nr:P-loop containing nucleoside triphosphate hydrolase protein [Aaosphaeria arxii CBS 175.79]KAF2009446.1 P-loop containing nucleoside triphosphate hydrolase protein [Aaosphaeria arxii CBS 175.79]
MQSVIQCLASEGGTKRVLELIKEDFASASSRSTVDSILSLLKTITFPKVLTSGLLEKDLGTIYNVIYGPGGRYALQLFTFIGTQLGSIDGEELEPVVVAFAKLFEFNENASLVDGFKKCIKQFEEALTRMEADSHAETSTRKWLERAQTRLGLNKAPISDVTNLKRTHVPRAKYIVRQDPPGNLRSAGPRHNNDHEDVRHIQILPTFEEIMANIRPYLPTIDANDWHLPGITGLLDRQFRLYREDVVGPIRQAIKDQLHTRTQASRIQPSCSATRTVSYTNLAFERFFCNSWNGPVLTITFDQPADVRRFRSHLDRAAAWTRSGRLQKDNLVCILDPAGRVVFCTVAEIKDDTPKRISPWHHDLEEDFDDEDSDTDEIPAHQDLSNDQLRARLTIAPMERKDLETILGYFQGQAASRRLILVEFPKVLIASFQPTLQALQSMIQMGDVPFSGLIAPSMDSSSPVIVDTPLYARARDFRYDLNSICSNASSMHLSLREKFDLNALISNSTLDAKQAEALVHALSRCLAICQGPPGTGKSYTALQLMKVLLANTEATNSNIILVVTYTNHALDQNMENCLDNGIDKIIRMGSRSKSERLQELNLRSASSSRDSTHPEQRAKWSRLDELNHAAACVSSDINDFFSADNPETLKGYLCNVYNEHYTQIFGPDEDGFETIAYGTDFIFTAWKAGRFGSIVRHKSRSVDELLEDEVSVREMTSDERDALYEFWVKDCVCRRRYAIFSALDSFYESKKLYEQARSEADLRCLEEASVIGVTTSGLARNINLLKRLPIKTLLVEEAGEVLEAHTLAALLPSIEHAILIGDHLQLRPSVTNYDLSSESKLGKQYSLDMSLFERLVCPPDGIPGVRLPFSTLETQRRMHNSISELIRRTKYPRLEDAPNVFDYPEVVGMKRRLFWLDHDAIEDGANADEIASTSKSNKYEVELVACLVAHLLSQGEYKPQDIAVITPYLGQLFLLRARLSSEYELVLDGKDEKLLKEMNKDQVNILNKLAGSNKANTSPMKATLLHSLKAATVDNFQGEEAKVVIVSLVRNNRNRNCGFLRTPNRINVLLSRAKHGMYIIGNSGTSAGVPMWSDVLTILEEGGNLSKKLDLCCPRHPDTLIQVSTPEDFSRLAPQGGCDLPCDRRLSCGHKCLSKCHADFRHDNFFCSEPCTRLKKGCDHLCKKKCGENCGIRCEEKLENINFKLPCSHVLRTLQCWEYQDKESIKCHECVDKVVPGCKHVLRRKCTVDVGSDDFRCDHVCGGQLECGHNCKFLCYQCANTLVSFGEKHGQCQNTCLRPYTSCSHKCRENCHPGTPCPPCKSQCDVACSHSRCNQLCGEPCTPCSEETCASQCPHSRCTMPCAAPCNWLPCSKRCSKKLGCGHQCPSVCGEFCPVWCQKCAPESIKNTVVDFIEMRSYHEVDVDVDPVIIPTCGHPIIMSNLDSSLGMSSVYTMSDDGKVRGIKPSAPFSASDMKDLPGCPTCRGSLRGVNRYGRLVRRVLLDESTKRFISTAGDLLGPLIEEFHKAQQKLSTKSLWPRSTILPPEFKLEGDRNDQLSAIFHLFGKWNRYFKIRSVRQKIVECFSKLNKNETPFAKIWKLAEVSRRRTDKTDRIDMESSVCQVTFHVMALSLLIRCDVTITTDVFNELEKHRRGPLRMKIKADFKENRKECVALVEDALVAKDYERAVEGHVFFARYCALEIPHTTSPNQAKNLKDEGEKHLQLAEELCKTHGGKLSSLASEIEDARLGLNGGFFNQPVTSEERRSVLAAMAKEFGSTTGHWYTCANGHPFSIGECGRPMELARCPQCDAQIGGQEHITTAGVERATDLEMDFGRMAL